MEERSAPGDEAALARVLPSRLEDRLWRLVPATPLLGWVIAAVFALFVWRDSTPPAPLLLLLVGTGALVLAYSVPLLAWAGVRMVAWFRAWRRMRRVARHLLARELEPAIALCLAVIHDRFAGPPAVLPALHALGVARLLQGRPEAAQALMDKVRDSGWLESFAFRAHRGPYAQGRAVVAVVLGEVERAEAELALARQWARGQAMAAYLGHAEALLALRRGDGQGMLARSAAVDLSQLPPHVRELMPLYEAFARHLDGEGAEDEPVRIEADRLPKWLAHWPELAAFAADHTV